MVTKISSELTAAIRSTPPITVKATVVGFTNKRKLGKTLINFTGISLMIRSLTGSIFCYMVIVA